MPKANPAPHMNVVRLILDRQGMEPREQMCFVSSLGAGSTQTLERAVLVRMANVSLPRGGKGPPVFSELLTAGHKAIPLFILNTILYSLSQLPLKTSLTVSIAF